MAIKIYNSITGKKEVFQPIEAGKVKMYACGVTVYDLCHIGHARQAVVYAMIADYLRYRGYEVKYVRNYTDVDDKIINRANKEGKTALQLSSEQIAEAEKDMAGLHVTDADIYTKASEYIEKIIIFIEDLIDQGYAYANENGDVYFSVRKFKQYGKLSKRNVDELLNGVRKEVEEGKQEALDFALWKSAKEGEIYWDSPWGKGRPGWHIECSVMANDTLGTTIDIHGGGRDLIFPHHENEVAQSEAHNHAPLAKYWSHCGLIKINGEKMSKSLGNSLILRDVLTKYNYEVIKYMLLSKHYTSDIDINESDFQLAESHMYYFYKTLLMSQVYIDANYSEVCENTNLSNDSNDIEENFIQNMDDDFNTVSAFASLFSIFKNLNSLLEKPKVDKNVVVVNIKNILNSIKGTYGVIGFLNQDPQVFINEIKTKHLSILGLTEENIVAEIEKRLQAKKDKNYALADKIRDDLEVKGIILKDNANTTEWDIKALY